MVRGLVLSATVMLVACGHTKVVDLADFHTYWLHAHVNRDGTEVEVRLRRPLRPGVDDRVDSPCFVIEDRVSGTLDDIRMEVVSRGAYVGKSHILDDVVPYCVSPTFRLAANKSPTPTSELRISDGTTTISVVIRSLRTSRGFALADALQRGKDAHFVWSVATDAVPEPGPCLGAKWTPEGWTPIGNDPPTSTVDSCYGGPGARVEANNTLVLSIPANAAPGPGTLSVGSPFDPTVVVCEGVARCEATADGPLPFRTTIAP